MILHLLSIVRLHGALSLEVAFNDEITLLVGINGSGKTSVLNVIDWLLKPDLKKLALASFERLSLEFSEGGTAYEIVATRTESKVMLTIAGGKHAPKPISVNLIKHIDVDDEDAGDEYDGLGPEKHEIPMWELLKSFPRPTVISLDRTISAESDEVQYVETSRGYAHRRFRQRSPLGYVQEVTSEKYAEFRTRAITNDNELKAQIVMSALQDPELAFKGGSIKPMTKAEISKLEEKVTTYLSGTIKSDDVTKQVRSFFNSSRLLAKRQQLAANQQNLLLDFVISQYRQIENLAKAFNDFETKNGLAFKSLHDYLTAINRFFNDSNKELYFDESTGKLVFSFIESQSKARQKRAISHLSSGERQILILFTFLAFASKSQSVFIVDEPELSLHPKWQHEFMETFLKLRPENTQLLLATHSPDIVGKFKNACVTLRGAKQ